MSKFNDVPVDEDTTILLQLETKFGEFDILYQAWTWEGVKAESIVFANEDVAEIENEEIKNDLR